MWALGARLSGPGSARRRDPSAFGLAAVVAQFPGADGIVRHGLARRRHRRCGRLARWSSRCHLAGSRTRAGCGWRGCGVGRWRRACRRCCTRVGLHAGHLALRGGRGRNGLGFTRRRGGRGRAGGLLGERRAAEEEGCCDQDRAHGQGSFCCGRRGAPSATATACGGKGCIAAKGGCRLQGSSRPPRMKKRVRLAGSCLPASAQRQSAHEARLRRPISTANGPRLKVMSPSSEALSPRRRWREARLPR